MTGKSRHGKRKLAFRGKKKKSRHHPPAVVTQASKPVSTKLPTKLPTPSVRAPTPTTLAPARYPYIIGELRRFSILAGMVLVILIVLALVLP
jgi:hypothetical protein